MFGGANVWIVPFPRRLWADQGGDTKYRMILWVDTYTPKCTATVSSGSTLLAVAVRPNY
jgi:hypothetical protein